MKCITRKRGSFRKAGSSYSTVTRAAGALCVSGLLAVSNAHAQLEEIIVTATKRDESAQDVPIQITSLGQEDIARYGVTDVYDLRGAVPGLEVRRATAFGNPTFTIRGVGATNFDTISGPTVATYIDDIPQVSSGQLNFTSFDIGNIEVLKGPQGTLFGSGTTAGVVHFKTNRPTTERESYIRLGAGNYGEFEFEGATSGALSENLAGRLSARVESFEGYYTNIAPNGGDAGGNDAYQIRGQLLRSGDTSEIYASAYYSKSDQEAILYQMVPLLADDGTGTLITCPIVQAALDRGRFTEADARAANVQCISNFGENNTAGGIDDEYTSNAINIYDDDSEVDLETYGFSVRADIDVGDNVFTTITGYSSTDHGGVDPEGPVGRAGATDVLWLSEVDIFSQEFQLASSDNSTHKWIVGLNYLNHEIVNDLRSALNFPSFGAEGSTIINETPAETLAGSVPYEAPQSQDSQEAGIYGQVDWILNENWTLITGLRGSWYRKEGTVEWVGGFAPVDTVLEESGLSFNLGFNHTPSDNVLLYGKVSQGIRSGSHAGGFIFSPDSAVGAEQETLLSYELGFKSLLAGDTLRLNGSAFFYYYSDVQSLSQRLVGTTFVQRYTNIGDAEVTGVDVDLSWAPSDVLFFKLAATFLDSEVTRSDNAIAIDFSGNSLANSPDLQYTVLGRYNVGLSSGSVLSFQYNGSFTDDQFRNVDNSALDFDESSFIHNAVITYTSPDEKWDISAWGRNLSEELDFTWQFSFGGVQRRSYNAPRTYGVSATYRF